MLTRCPACATAYRVSGAQLDIAAGQVRCGRCGQLFVAREPRPQRPLGLAAAEPTPGAPGATLRRWAPPLAWGLGCALLVLGLGLQWLWWNRDQVTNPRAIELVQTLCRLVQCQSALPPDLAQLEVLSRSLDPHPDRPGLLQFHLKLANRAARPQPYPGIELRLFDQADNPVAARRFAPAEYLPAGSDPRALLSPEHPLELTLNLEAPERWFAGFQIDFL